MNLPVGAWCDSGVWSGSAPGDLGSAAPLTILGIVIGTAGDHGPWAHFSLEMLTRWGISFPVLRDTSFTT